MKDKRKVISWISIIVCFLIFLFVFLSIIKNNSVFFDETIISFIEGIRNNTLTSICKVITYLGEAKIILIVAVLLGAYYYFVKKNKQRGILVVFNMVNVAVLNQGIKMLVKRPRPLNMLVEETGYSFPSGHSMISMGFYGLLIYFVNTSKLSKTKKIIYTIILSFVILAVGFSRIYLCAHYPSDIIGGYMITLSYLILFVMLFNKYIKKDIK